MTAAPVAAPQTLRVLVVDDEAMARLRLHQLLADCHEPAATVVAEFEDATAALAWLHAGGQADVALLDIRMPGRDGLQLAHALQRLPTPPALVFVTAHPQHALRAFELQALDYLQKPVRRERLQASLARVPRRELTNASRGDTRTDAETAPVLVVAERGRVLRIPANEVVYLRAEMKYVTLRTATRSHVLDDSLSELEQRLGPANFLRIHRNTVVARQAMRELALRPGVQGEEDGWALRVVPGDEWLAVSRRQVAAVREALAGRPDL